MLSQGHVSDADGARAMEGLSPAARSDVAPLVAIEPIITPDWVRGESPPVRPGTSKLIRGFALALALAAGATLVMVVSSRLDQTTSSSGSRSAWAAKVATLTEPVDLHAEFIDEINALRRDHDLGALDQHVGLTEAAQSWAGSLSMLGELDHAPDVRDGAPEAWTKLGENVGFGMSVDQIMTAFRASDDHLQTLVDPTHSLVGVGIVEDSDGTIWTVHRFASVFSETENAAPD